MRTATKRTLQEAYDELTAKLGENPTSDELARETGNYCYIARSALILCGQLEDAYEQLEERLLRESEELDELRRRMADSIEARTR